MSATLLNQQNPVTASASAPASAPVSATINNNGCESGCDCGVPSLDTSVMDDTTRMVIASLIDDIPLSPNDRKLFELYVFTILQNKRAKQSVCYNDISHTLMHITVILKFGKKIGIQKILQSEIDTMGIDTEEQARKYVTSMYTVLNTSIIETRSPNYSGSAGGCEDDGYIELHPYNFGKYFAFRTTTFSYMNPQDEEGMNSSTLSHDKRIARTVNIINSMNLSDKVLATIAISKLFYKFIIRRAADDGIEMSLYNLPTHVGGKSHLDYTINATSIESLFENTIDNKLYHSLIYSYQHDHEVIIGRGISCNLN